MTIAILVVVAAIIAAAFFAGAETALTAASRARMQALETGGDRRAALAEMTGDDPPARVERLIAGLGLPQHISEFRIGEPELTRAAAELGGKYPAADLLRIYLAAV